MEEKGIWRNQFLLLFVAMIASACSAAVPEQVTLTQTAMPSATPAPTLTSTPIPTLPPGVSNVVKVDFFNSFRFHTMSYNFTNLEVKGFLHSAIILQNMPDDSRAPVYGLGLEFSTEPGIMRGNVQKEYLEIIRPPFYKWFFGNVPEEPIQNVYMSEAYFEAGGSSFMAPFTPGFDASLSYDNTTFSEAGTQTVTLTIVPRQELYGADFIFHLDGGAFGGAADVVITSLTPGEHRGPAGERITVTPDRKNIGVDDLPLIVNEPYSFSMTLRVEPHKPNAMYTIYRPYLGIAWLPGEANRGTALGNTLTVPVDNIGIWTWTAIGEYLWEWQGPGTQYEVSFN